MKMTLELYDQRYIVETLNPKQNDFDSGELKELFTRIMVMAGFGPSVLDPEDGGHYEYVGDDEIVIKKEYLDELKSGQKTEKK